MRIITFFIFSLFSLALFGQSVSEADIKTLADQVNKQFKGLDIGNGITGRGCLSIGRTLIYQYDVPEYWEASKNIKDELIANLKADGAAKTFFLSVSRMRL